MAARTTSWSENGKVRSPTIWPVSWPLPATTARRLAAARGPRCGWPRRGRRSRARPARAARISARIAAGLLAARIVVGDDHDVGLLGRDRAHDRPLAAVAVAAAAEHADEPARGEGAQRVEHMRQRVGLVGVVDDARAPPLTSPTRLEPARHAVQTAQARRARRRVGLASAASDEARRRAARSRPGRRRAAAALVSSQRRVRQCVERRSFWREARRRAPREASALSPCRPVVSTRQAALGARLR